MDNKSVLITGGAGFVGHHAVEHLLKSRPDISIKILDGLSYAGSLNRLTDIALFSSWVDEGRLEFIYHDIRAPIEENCDVWHRIGSVDYIIHMAAETSVDKSISDPSSFVQANFVGTFNMLQYALRLHQQREIKLFIQVSTDEVYGKAEEGVYYEEWDTLRPSNPYSATKAAADCLAYSFHETYGLPVVVTRTMNNFGERQHPEKLIGCALRSILNGVDVIIHGESPEVAGSRCWLHARNHADALLFLMERDIADIVGDIFHIVGEEKTNLEIVGSISDIVGVEAKLRFVDFSSCRPGHDKRYAMSGKKMENMGWRAPMTFSESFKRTIQWTLSRPEWIFPDKYTEMKRRTFGI